MLHLLSLHSARSGLLSTIRYNDIWSKQNWALKVYFNTTATKYRTFDSTARTSPLYVDGDNINHWKVSILFVNSNISRICFNILIILDCQWDKIHMVWKVPTIRLFSVRPSQTAGVWRLHHFFLPLRASQSLYQRPTYLLNFRYNRMQYDCTRTFIARNLHIDKSITYYSDLSGADNTL